MLFYQGLLLRSARIKTGIVILFLIIAANRDTTAQSSDRTSKRSNVKEWQLLQESNGLESISIDDTAITELGWVRSGHLLKLEVLSKGLASLHGLSRARGLNQLSLNLVNSRFTNLDELRPLRDLHELTLNLGGSRIRNLSGLSNLKSLQRLTLSPPDSLDLSTLADLPALEKVTLQMGGFQGQSLANIAGLTQLRGVRELIVDLDDARIRELPDFSKVANLRDLTLNLEGDSGLGSLKNLRVGADLKALTLKLMKSSISQLPNLLPLQSLHCLRIGLSAGIPQVPAELTRLANLEALTLDLSTSSVRELPDLGPLQHLHSLTLTNAGGLTKLPDLTKTRNLTSLTLDIHASEDPDAPHISEIPGLDQLVHLQSLDLDIRNTNIKNLADLAKLEKLEKITLHLDWAQIPLLPELSALTPLRRVVLFLGKPLQGITPAQLPSVALLPGIQELTLNLGAIASLPDLSHLAQLRDLTVNVNHARWWKEPNLAERNLTNMAHLEGLRALTVYAEDANIDELPSLVPLKSLRHLALHLKGAHIQSLPDISQCTALESIDLDLEGSEIRSLPDLGRLNNLKSVYLNIAQSHIRDLATINNVGVVEELTLDSGFDSLRKPPYLIKRLTLVRRHSDNNDAQ